MQNNENSIPFVPVKIEDAAATDSPAAASKRSFDLANEREKRFEDMVSQVSNFEELANVINNLGEYVPTTLGPQTVVNVVSMPINNIRHFYTTIKNDNEQRPDNAIIGEMLLKIPRSYNLRSKVGQLVAKEMDELFR